MMKQVYIILGFFILLPFASFAQEEDSIEVEIDTFAFTDTTEPIIKKWSLRGYVKDLRTLYFLPNFDNMAMDNMIHNRLFFEWYPSEHWSVKADLRNRIFYGNTFQTMPMSAYSDLITDANNDYFDLSAMIMDKDAFLLHSMIDRLYADYTKDKLQISLGRQRINWGINTFFNPNDIFNSYNFTDFDYEERPGSDALRIQYYTGAASSVEVAIKAFDEADEIVAGALWKFNTSNYDFQVLSGVANKDIVLGGGWAGSIQQIGFKGEFSTFLPYENLGDSLSFAGTLGLDYFFGNSAYLSAGFLLNSNGTTESLLLSGGNLLNSTEPLSAKNLYPYQYAIFTAVAYPFSPMLNGGISVVYSPSDDQALFISPTLTYSVKDNLAFDAIGQFFALNFQNQYTLVSKAIFIRLKWSF
jgi:hypothetical protein